jgi:hypothetical protein
MEESMSIVFSPRPPHSTIKGRVPRPCEAIISQLLHGLNLNNKLLA